MTHTDAALTGASGNNGKSAVRTYWNLTSGGLPVCACMEVAVHVWKRSYNYQTKTNLIDFELKQHLSYMAPMLVAAEFYAVIHVF